MIKYIMVTTLLTNTNKFDSVADYRSFVAGIGLFVKQYQTTELCLANGTILSQEEILLSPTTVQSTLVYPSHEDLEASEQVRREAVSKTDSDLALAALGWTGTSERKTIWSP